MKHKNWIQKIVVSLFVLFTATNLFAFSADCTRDVSGDSFLPPEKFENGQPADADAVNKNFDCVYQAVDNIEKGVTVKQQEGSSKITLNGSVNFNGLNMLVITGFSCPDQPWEAVVEHKLLSRKGLGIGAHGSFEIVANFSHCVGGCYYSFRRFDMLFNYYQWGQVILSDIEKNTANTGTWSIERIQTGIYEPNGEPISSKFKIKKSVGTIPANACGPVDIRVLSNYPLKLISKSDVL